MVQRLGVSGMSGGSLLGHLMRVFRKAVGFLRAFHSGFCIALTVQGGRLMMSLGGILMGLGGIGMNGLGHDGFL